MNDSSMLPRRSPAPALAASAPAATPTPAPTAVPTAVPATPLPAVPAANDDDGSFCFTYSETKWIISLNNDAATKLASASPSSGTEAAAQRSLVRALQASRSTMENRDNSRRDTSVSNDDEKEDTGEETKKRPKLEVGGEDPCLQSYQEPELPFNVDRIMVTKSGGHNEGDVESSDDCRDVGYFVCDEPIFIKESYASHRGLQRSETALPSIILFNIALANHVWAIRTINGEEDKTTKAAADSHQRLQKAVELYHMSLRMATIGSSRKQQCGGELLYLSCLNNLGHAHGLLGDHRSEEAAHDKLLTALMYLASNKGPRKDAEEDVEEERRQHHHRYEQLFRNIFKKGTSSKAPAA